MNQFIQALEIKSFLVDVSEKIDDKNLLNFTKTQLTLNDYSLNQNDFLGSIYIEEAKKQFIFISEYTNRYFYFDLLCEEIKNLKEEFICIICDDVIYLFKNHQIYYFKVLNFQLKDDEIENLLFDKLNINIQKILTIDNEKLIELKENSNIKNTFLNLNRKKRVNYFRFYISFILSSVLIIFLLFSFEGEKEPEKIIYKKYNYLSLKLNKAFELLNKKELNIEEVVLNKKLKIFITIDKSSYTQELIKSLTLKFRLINSAFDVKTGQYRVELDVK